VTPSELVEDDIEPEAEVEPVDVTDVAVAVPKLALFDAVPELADETALPSELDAIVLEVAAEPDDAEEEALDPVDEVSDASLANPTAAGEYRYTLYTFLSMVSPTIHCTEEVEESDCT
jgi:hypothetical protein